MGEEAKDCPYECRTQKLTQEIHQALIGDMDGKEGLVTRVARHDRALTTVTRVLWLVIAALVSGAGAMVLDAFKR